MATLDKPIVAFAGPAGAGKSTLAGVLCREAGGERIPFAGPLKKMLEAAGVPPASLYGDQKETPLPMLCGKSGRYAMQTLGTEWGRDLIGQDIWGNLWEHAVRASTAPLIVVDDLRFDNEVRRVQRLGGAAVLVLRDMSQLNDAPAHPSEDFAQLRCDLTVVNDRSKSPEAVASQLLQLLAAY